MSNNNEQFLKRNPLDILSILRNLHKQQTPLCAHWSGGQFMTKILNVTRENFTIDFSNSSRDNDAIQRVTIIQITAETNGAKIEFSLPGLRIVNYADQPAFIAHLPQVLWFFQRREYFRIEAPLQANYNCRTRFTNGTPFLFNLRDLSLGGMGALLNENLPDELHEGANFKHVELDLDSFGKLHLDMELVSISERKIINRKNETVVMPRLSFRFLNVTPAQERELQFIIFSLERSVSQKAKRVR